ncbi:MAG: cytochrome c biogenesis protein CcsA [Anaerosomatales bacterium]|nr:cytochrome c biogenesis protein CcsA [Anaerosomatales bacterium]MDT8434020.1 cytochrome c biogenesis protein CcsA [Anaerosomatales bacterium]
MSTAESVLIWSAAALYAAATILAFSALVWGRREMLRWSIGLAVVGCVAHAVAIGVRWYSAGHFPYVEDYENVLVGSFAMVAAYLAMTYVRRGFGVAAVVVLPTVLITLGYGVTQAGAIQPVTPPYQSAWLVIHVTFAWITYAAYSAVAGLAVIVLWRERARSKAIDAPILPEWIPSEEETDDVSMRLVAFGFLNNAVMIASGSIWAYRLWGSFWRWDPVETWSLLTWLAYGFYMHAHFTLGWRGRRLAWVALLALLGVLMAFWGVQLLPNSYHLFNSLGETLSNQRF